MISAVFITFRKSFDPHKLRLHLTPKAFFFDAFQKLPSGNTGPTHTVTHTRKRADGSSGNRDVEEYFNSSENDQKRPENDIFRIFLLFVISRSGVRVRLPAPIFPQRSKVNMGEFPSGRFHLVLVLFCHVRGFLHSAGAKGLNDMTGGVFCIIGNSSVLSRAERHIGRSLRFRW